MVRSKAEIMPYSVYSDLPPRIKARLLPPVETSSKTPRMLAIASASSSPGAEQPFVDVRVCAPAHT